MSDDASSSCRVCGYEHRGPRAELPRGADGESPTSTYCSCCGVEFGYQDTSPAAARAFRERWLADGAPWAAPRFRPPGWDLEAQLRQVPPEYCRAAAPLLEATFTAWVASGAESRIVEHPVCLVRPVPAPRPGVKNAPAVG
jgi:hypothetical protein